MLDAIRIIVQGHGNAIETPARPDVLRAFEDAARQRWAQLVQDLPPDDAARMPLGHYEVSSRFWMFRPPRRRANS